MQHIDIRRVLAERLQALLESQEHLPITPRPYQSETLVCLRDWLDDSSGNRRGYISQATGLGKTWLFSAVVSHCAGLRTLIIVPTKVLIEQTARFIVKFTGGIIGHLSSLERIRGMNGEIIAVRGHEHSDVVITTDESFIKHADSIAAEFGPHFIIWDECHWGYTRAAQQALAYFPEAAILGFSATPDYLGTVARSGFAPVTLDNRQVLYSDQSRLAKNHFGTMINERTVRWGIENRWLAPFAWGMVECDIPLDQIPTALTAAGMDYHEAALQAFMSHHWSLIVEVVRRLYADPQYTLPERQVFAVCPSVKTAMSLAQTISELGVSVACITGDTPNAIRRTILRSFASGKVKLLTSVMVLREGWDAPNAEVCLMLRPTKSRVLYMQSMGRVLRPSIDGTHKVALVVDTFFQRIKFSPLSAPVLFGTPGQTVTERDILIRPKPVQGASSSSSEATAKTDEEIVSPYLSPDAKPRLVFVHPLEIEYWAGEDGTFEADGEKWANRSAFRHLWGISLYLLRQRLRQHNIPTRPGRDRVGKIVKFYPVAKVEAVCTDIVEATNGGFACRGVLNIAGEIWASRWALARFLKTKQKRIAPYLMSREVRNRITMSRSRGILTLYSLADVKKLHLVSCQSHPRAGRAGFIKYGGHLWGTLTSCAQRFGKNVQPNAVKYWIKKRGIRHIIGWSRTDTEERFYPLVDVRQAVAHILTKCPRARYDGTFRTDGVLWATKKTIAKRMAIGVELVTTLIISGDIRSQVGRAHRGRSIPFYALSDIEKAIERQRQAKQPRPCSYDGCPRTCRGRQKYCKAHYQQIRRGTGLRSIHYHSSS